MKHFAFAAKTRKLGAGRLPCFFAALAALSAALFASCAFFSASGNGGEITVMTYNTQTFFDQITSGTEFSEFRQKEWTEELYAERLQRLAQVLSEAAVPPKAQDSPLMAALSRSMPKKGNPPSIAVLQEIENEAVLRDAVSFLPSQDFYKDIAFIPAGKNGAFSTGILSVYPIESVTIHGLEGSRPEKAISASALSSLRPTAEITLATDRGQLVLFAAHWKSKGGSGAAEENKNIRLLQEEVLAERISRLEKERPGTPFIVCGDFNQQPEDFAIMGKYLSAWDFLPQESGTYFWRGSREKIDNIFVSPLFKKSLDAGESVFFVAEHDFLFGIDGEPTPFRVHTGRGYSDHLPLVFRFQLGAG